MNYTPLVHATAPPLRVTALVGATTVVLGFDLAEPWEAALLGFAVRRVDLADGAETWLKNPLKFARSPYVGYQVAGTDSRLAPFQQFHWVDEGVQPGHTYRYTIATVVGRPAQPTLRDTCDLQLRAADLDADPIALVFNRGVTATPAYRTQFDTRMPSTQPPALRAAAEAYLSRGLREGLLAFLAAAKPGDRLDVAIYEFQDQQVVAALTAAFERGVAVRVIAHAKDDHTGHANAPFLQVLGQHVGPGLTIVRRRNVPALSHNKVVVHTAQGVPARVWTGSTNFTAQAFFRQTNVGIIVSDPALARVYADYLDLLAADLPGATLRPAVRALVAAQPPEAARKVFFAPSNHDAMLDAAVAAIEGARDVVMISCPFGLDDRLSVALAALDPRVLVYGMLNANQKGDLAVINRDGRAHSLFVLPTWIEQLNAQEYDASTGRGNQIHVKSLVVDPWGEAPTVLIGSANFSDESVFQNDENALLLRGERGAGAAVATEFLRVFGHYRFRNRLKQLAQPYDTTPLPGQGMFLGEAEEDEPVWLIQPGDVGVPGARVLGVKIDDLWLDESGAWRAPYQDESHPKRRERAVFAAGS